MQPTLARGQRLSDRQPASLQRFVKANRSRLLSAGCVFDDGVLDGQFERVEDNDIGRSNHCDRDGDMAVKGRAGQVGLKPQFVSDGKDMARQAKGIVGIRRKLIHEFSIGCFCGGVDRGMKGT